MFWGEKLNTAKKYSVEIKAGQAFTSIFGSLRMLVLIDNCVVTIGRGSSGCLTNFKYYQSQTTQKRLVTVGDFCEFAACKILIGGEHNNANIFNGALNSFPHVASLLTQADVPVLLTKNKGELSIGSNVLVSHGATILSGLQIATGAVIGAGAVVVKSIPDNGVYAGNPAKKISVRFKDAEYDEIYKKITWEDISIKDYFWLAKHLLDDKRKELTTRLDELEKDTRKNYVVFNGVKGPDGLLIPRDMVGVCVDNKVVKLPEMDKNFVEYLKQATDAGKTNIEWLPDPFRYFGVN